MSLDVFDGYNNALIAHGLKPYAPFSKYRDQFERFHQWCVKHGVDPVRWIHARHESIKWARRVPIESLASDKFLANFQDWGDQKTAGELGQDRLSAQAEIAVYPSEAMREMTRRAYARDRDHRHCYLTATVGDGLTRYDEESPTCGVCPLMETCSEGSI